MKGLFFFKLDVHSFNLHLKCQVLHGAMGKQRWMNPGFCLLGVESGGATGPTKKMLGQCDNCSKTWGKQKRKRSGKGWLPRGRGVWAKSWRVRLIIDNCKFSGTAQWTQRPWGVKLWGRGSNRKAMEKGRSQVKGTTQATLKEIRLFWNYGTFCSQFTVDLCPVPVQCSSPHSYANVGQMDIHCSGIKAQTRFTNW